MRYGESDKRLSRRLRIAACVGMALVAAFLGSCNIARLLSDGGAIAFRIDAAAAKSARILLPSIDMTVASYSYAGAGPGGVTFSAKSSNLTYTASNLVQGSWSVTVNALNAAGTVVGTGTGSVRVVTGQTATANIAVVPISGNGTLSVALTWPAALVSIPQVKATLTSSTGAVTTLAFSAPSSGTSSYTGSVANGYYTLAIQLLDNGQLVTGSVEIARIVAGQTTAGTYNYSSINVGQGSIIVNITPALSNPIPVTLTGTVATVATATPVNLTASVPAGSTVTYVWYVNGTSVGTGASYALNTASSPLAPGSYRIDCAAFSTNGQNAGDATFFVNVTAAVSVTLEWNAPAASNVAGYKIYVGMSAGKYGTGMAVGNVLSYTVTGLARGVTYYFAATAVYATAESAYSNEVSWTGS